MTEGRFRGAGGTPGGMGQFFSGLLMTGIGAYLVLNQVQVTSNWGSLWGVNSFGLSLVPLLVGIGFLFYDGKSVVGWILTVLGFGILLAGILMHMEIYFRTTSLYNTLLMLALLAGGLGLIARSLRPKTSGGDRSE